MKTNRYIVVFSVVILLTLSVVAGGIGAQQSFPDFLGEDSTETDFLDDPPEVVVNDPLEPMNRVFFEFNDVLYEWVVKPVSDGYSWVFPLELRQGFGNFFDNLAMPIRLINFFMMS